MLEETKTMLEEYRIAHNLPKIENYGMCVEHNPISEDIFKFIKKVDLANGDFFMFKSGGDGDNGEVLMSLLDEYFKRIGERMITFWTEEEYQKELDKVRQETAKKIYWALKKECFSPSRGYYESDGFNAIDWILKDIIEKHFDVEIKEEASEAEWQYWPGWASNHDHRIDDAICSKCGYHHPIVFNGPNELKSHCPNCKSKMKRR